MSVAIAICAHVDRIADALSLAHLSFENAAIALDDGSLGSTANHARAWRYAVDAAEESGADWVGVIEDDAVPVHGIDGELAAMLASAPSPLVSGYLGTSYPKSDQLAIEDALALDPQWIVGTGLLHHVAVFARIDVAREIIRYLESGHAVSCDMAIGIIARRYRWPVSYCVPSLFDHADDEPVIDPTTRPPGWGPSRRRAWTTGTRPYWTADDVVPLDSAALRAYPGVFRGSAT